MGCDQSCRVSVWLGERVRSGWWRGKSFIEESEAGVQDTNFIGPLGASVFMGILPLDMVLGVVGETVIDDWLLCRSWIKSYRDSEGTISQVEATGVGDVDYHRRHAEWLVLVTVEWVRKNWQYPNCNKVAEAYGGKGNLPPRIQSLSRVDKMLMPPIVKEQVRSLTGIRI